MTVVASRIPRRSARTLLQPSAGRVVPVITRTVVAPVRTTV